MTLENSIAFVTGGSSGLGTSICRELANEGANVAVGYFGGTERAKDVCSEIEVLGRKAIPIRIALENPTSIDGAVKEVVDQLGGLDILINNAAMAMGGHTVPPGDLDAFTPEIWDEMMAINLRGPYLVTRAAASHLRSSNWGKVVNIGSTISHGEWYADRPFAPSKAAVVPLTRFLASALAPEVAVNCVCPGLMVETGLGSGAPEHLVEGWRKRSALNVTTSVDDVAGQVVYLCKTSAITGQSIVVDGGVHFH